MNRTDLDRTKLLQVALTLAIIGTLALLAGSIVSGPQPAERTAAVDPARVPERPPAPPAP
jgi:hypothetical protein